MTTAATEATGASGSTAADPRETLVARLTQATIGTWDLFAAHLGLALGLYRALADRGSMTSAELAATARIDERYAREWLEHQAVTGFVEADGSPDAATRRYTMPPAHAEVLLDTDSLLSGQSMIRAVASAAGMLQRLVAAYRTGDGVPASAYPDPVGAQESSNRALFRHVLAQEWLPAIPDIHARLMAGGRIADLATGAGWAAIVMANAYPRSTVDGLDIDPESIAWARRNAAAEGADPERLRFHVVDAGRNDLDGRYDLVTIFEALHDMARPVQVLAAAKALLAPGGTVLVVDERVGEGFEAPGGDRERLMYGYSLLFCLPNGLTEKPSAATGTVMRPSILRCYAAEAGFASVTVLPIDHEGFQFYRLDP